MQAETYAALRAELEDKKEELTIRLERITKNLRRGYHPDSKERAKELEDSEVVDALGNEARAELRNVSAALQRMDAGEYGICVECGTEIDGGRIKAHPYAKQCIDCARLAEEREALHARSSCLLVAHEDLAELLQRALLRFEPATETFTVFTLPSESAKIRQILGRPGEVWGAESGTDKLVVVRTR